MRNVLAMACIMLVAASAYTAELTVHAGGNVTGNERHEDSGGFSLNGESETGLAFGAEITGGIGSHLRAGGGVEYLFSRNERETIKGYQGKFGFAPLYGTLKYSFPGSRIFGRANAGYNIGFDGDTAALAGAESYSGGLYWALGLGLMATKSFSVEVLYSSYTGTAEGGGNRVDFNYTPVSLRAGYSFGI